MAYSEFEQLTIDLNWYFTDFFHRIYVATTGGGLLPTIIVNNDVNNDKFHEIIYDLPRNYKVIRNESIVRTYKNIKDFDVELYFKDFEALASRGLYVYDKVYSHVIDDMNYVLVAHPIYDSSLNKYPIDRRNLALIPKARRPIISRSKKHFSLKNYEPINVSLLF